jgi:purine-binding chemotaxis protein CheW
MDAVAAEIDSSLEVVSSADQYLTFIMADEEYGVDILRVQEIKGWDTVTPLPNTPEYVKGVINLRGTIVPIIDLRERFGLETVSYGPTTVVIVLKVNSQKGQRVMGIVVDAVSEVYNVPDEELKPAPDFGSSMSTEVVKGLATVEEKMVILLDIDRLLDEKELNATEEIG